MCFICSMLSVFSHSLYITLYILCIFSSASCCRDFIICEVSHSRHPYSLSFLRPVPGGEQHVPGVSDRKQLRVLHHLAHGGAGPRRHQDEGGHAAGLRAHPQLQLLCESSSPVQWMCLFVWQSEFWDVVQSLRVAEYNIIIEWTSDRITHTAQKGLRPTPPPQCSFPLMSHWMLYCSSTCWRHFQSSSKFTKSGIWKGMGDEGACPSVKMPLNKPWTRTDF